MTIRYRHIILRHCRSLQPIPTEQPSRIATIEGVRAVLFDVYGTMLISASGEVGTAAGEAKSTAFSEAFASAGIACRAAGGSGPELLWDTIRRHHEQARARGIEYPEVEIRDVWRDVLGELRARGQTDGEPPARDIERLAVEYEVRTNPVWPMPNLQECLARLRSVGHALGIVSNAQFFTRELFPALLDQTVEQLGFSDRLQLYSYRSEQAKPGTFLYEAAREALSSLAIRPDEVLYVGNDMLNDVGPARQVGFKTALFAGDARSLRLREGDPRVAGVRPDVVVTDLAQLGGCVDA
jgi:putative hydrolase of the HAD superfamily